MIFWTGWLLIGNDESNKWRKRLFRVRDTKLEYLKSSNLLEEEELAQQQAQGGTWDKTDHGNASPFPFSLRGLQQTLASTVRAGDTLSHGNTSGQDSPQPLPSSTMVGQGSEVSTPENRNRGIAEEVQEAPRDWINLEDVDSFYVLGDDSVMNQTLAHHILLSSKRHIQFHQGNTKMIIVCRNHKRMWRLSLPDENTSDISSLFLVIERAMQRGVVLAAGWMSTPGTINYNRRYALLLSSGHLLLYKDSSLENLRRVLWLGEEGCSIQSIKSMAEVGTVDDRTMIEGLARSHQSSKPYIEAVTLRVIHPSISDKKGYLMTLERLNDQESPALHAGRFRDWLRLLQECCQEATRLYFRLRTPEGAFAEYRMRATALRSSHESHTCLEKLVETNQFLPTPSILQLARVGFPPHLRKSIWSGFAARLVQQESGGRDHTSSATARLNRLSLYPTARSPGFPYPLQNEFTKEQWLRLGVEEMIPIGCTGAQKELVVNILLELSELKPSISLSTELAHTVQFLVAMDFQENTSVLQLLDAALSDGVLAYHVHATSMKTVIDSFILQNRKSNEKDQDEADDAQHPQQRDNARDTSLPLHVDVQVALDVVSARCPQLSVDLVEQCEAIVSRWFLSGFSMDVPFPIDVTRRLWDIFVVQLHIDDTNHTCDMLIRLCVAIFQAVQEHLPLNGPFEKWQAVLTNPQTFGKPAMEIADNLQYSVAKDRQLLKISSWALLKERRSALWSSIELEAKERAVLVGRWLKTVKNLSSLSNRMIELSNRVNAAKVPEERRLLCKILEPLHLNVVVVNQSLAALEEALEMCHNSLVRLGPRSFSGVATIAQDITLSLEENMDSTNVKFLRGGQVALNPMLVIDVVRSSIALGWSCLGSCEKALHFADVKAYQSLSMLTKWIGTQDLKKDSGNQNHQTSLSGLAPLIRPIGDPKPPKHQKLALRLLEELRKNLTKLMGFLDDLAQCIVDTSVEQQRRAADNTFTSKHLVHDIFGGQIQTLSRLVPFIMNSVEEIRQFLETDPDRPKNFIDVDRIVSDENCK